MEHITSSDGFLVAMLAFLVVWYVTPTAVALLRGVEPEPLMSVILVNVIPLGWPAALIMAFVLPGRDRARVELPRVPGYPLDPRYPPGDPRARYPLP